MNDERKIDHSRPEAGFEPTSFNLEQRIEMMLEFDERKDEPEDLRTEDLDTENTWPSRRGTRA